MRTTNTDAKRYTLGILDKAFLAKKTELKSAVDAKKLKLTSEVLKHWDLAGYMLAIRQAFKPVLELARAYEKITGAEPFDMDHWFVKGLMEKDTTPYDENGRIGKEISRQLALSPEAKRMTALEALHEHTTRVVILGDRTEYLAVIETALKKLEEI